MATIANGDGSRSIDDTAPPVETRTNTHNYPNRFYNLNILSILLGTSLLGAGFAVPFERGTAFFAWSAACMAYAIYAVFLLFARRLFMLSTLLLFLAYGNAIIWGSNYVAGLPMSSWRAGWEDSYSFPEALGASIQYVLFLSILSIFSIAFMPERPAQRFAPLGREYTLPIFVLTTLSGITLIAIAGTQARDEYLRTADIGSMFLVQASSIMLGGLFAFTLFFMATGTYRNVINTILVIIALIVGMNGFRFILIIFAFIGVFYILATRNLSARWVLALLVGFAAGYTALLIIAYTRSVGMTFGEALAFLIQPDFEAAYGYAGASDQANLIAQDYYYQQGAEHLLNGRTYVDAFLRLAPNIVHTTYFETIRGQDYIMQTGSFVPEVFRRNNWTMGAHLFVEAIFNFGKWGPYLVLSALAVILSVIERLARKSPITFLGYIVTASMGYSLAWYGFANSLKQGAFAFLCSAIIIASGRFLARDRTDNHSRTL